MAYAIPIILVVAIGLIAGIVLTVASKVMAVHVDETILLLREVLPGANCGGCGFAGCDDYATALFEDETIKPNQCTPGGVSTGMALAEILGVEYEGAADKFAIIKCAGSLAKTNNVMNYQGWQSCLASKAFYRGRGLCDKSCLALGDCAKVCNYGAIAMENGLAVINRAKCVGCGACTKVCPNDLIEVVPGNTRIVAACSTDKVGAHTKQLCDIGCIACNLCVKTCKFEAIEVVNNKAVIDYTKCKNCGLCAKVCPRHVIEVLPKRIIRA